MSDSTPHVVEGRLYVPYHNWYGMVASRFFSEIRDHKRILGTRCASCEKVYMPPRSTCPLCLASLEEWVELPPTGDLITYTVVKYAYSRYYQPAEPPYPVGIVRLDGAHTGLCHLLGEVEIDGIAVGMRVEAVFRDERKGNILDIAYFRPLR
jgi:uncharacterized OB-fold protein